MFTNCPDCSRQFRVRASQLAQAEGLVQCGYCGKQFSALDRLYDKPLVIDKELLIEEEAGMAEPEFYIPEVTDEAEPAESSEEIPALGEIDVAIDTPASNFETGENIPPVETSTVDSESSLDDYPFQADLEEDEKPKAGIALRLFWSFGVLLLLLVGTAQAAWFNRDILLSHYPQYLPQARDICEHFKCKLIRNRNISAISLVNRDVRIHPRYEDALLVNATMINLSKYTQRYPLVLLSLFDTNGKVIAYRRVPPADYLDSSMAIDEGMAADTPVHFVLEVADSDIGAVSFEFDFL